VDSKIRSTGTALRLRLLPLLLFPTATALSLGPSAAGVHAVRRLPRPCSATTVWMAAADNQELGRLRATLEGLLADGFEEGALAPLREKISALEERMSASACLPPLTKEQRAIWDLSDQIDDEAERKDEDAPQRLEIRRQERKFLLSKLLDADRKAYLGLLPLLSERGALSTDDLPTRNVGDGVVKPMDTPAAVEASVVAIEAALAKMEANRAAAKANRPSADAARAEESIEAKMRQDDAAVSEGVSRKFAQCFIVSEEARLGLPHRAVGVDAWTDALERTRVGSFRTFFDRLLEGATWVEAQSSLASADPLVLYWAKDYSSPNIFGGGGKPLEGVVNVQDRFAEAWRADDPNERARFVYLWTERLPASVEDDFRDDPRAGGMARLRRQGASSDPMSRKAGPRDFTSDLNEWWNRKNDELWGK
jgi:hypothetical protein